MSARRSQNNLLRLLDMALNHDGGNIRECQVVVFVADDLGFLGPWIPDLVTEFCPPQNTTA